jgi:hypothetical protein
VAKTVAHNLGQAPKFMLVKKTSGIQAWSAWHTGISADKYLVLNTTAAAATLTTMWNNQAPGNYSFSVGTDGNTNADSASYIAYLWAEVPGFSKIGSYVGNGSSDGPFINCGFKPRLIGFKTLNYGGATDWPFVNASSAPANPAGYRNWWSINNVEFSTSVGDINSNGFKFRDNDPVYNGNYNYIYYAFAESPFALNNRMR